MVWSKHDNCRNCLKKNRAKVSRLYAELVDENAFLKTDDSKANNVKYRRIRKSSFAVSFAVLLLKTKFANRMQTGMTRMKAMKQEIPTPASIRKAYVEEYLKRRPDAEEFEFYEAIMIHQ